MKTSTVNVLKKNLQQNPFFVKNLERLHLARAGKEKPSWISPLNDRKGI
jgi:hypothetical protein